MLNSINISNLLIPEHFSHHEKRKNVIIIIWEHRNQIGIWTEETPQPMRKSFQWENQLKCNACEIVGGAAIKIPI